MIPWTLLHSLWESALIALVLALALCLLRSSRARYAAACLALVATMAAFAITLNHFMPAALEVRAGPIPRISVTGALSPFSPSSVGTLPRWITPLWLTGVILFQLRTLSGWLAVLRLRRKGVCAVSPQWQARLQDLACSLQVSRPVLLLQSSLAEVPVVIGHLRPVVLIPLGLLTGLPPGQIEAILLHELAHIRRRDYLVNLLQTIAEGLLFYHPAVWWISSVIRTERENCCDDLVVATTGDAHEYATALTSLAEAGHVLAMAATTGSLVNRIRRLLTRHEGPRPVLAVLLLTVACSAAMLAFQTPAPYTHWVQEDVAYIITDQERSAFKRLTTPAELERFIEQFWERRDPTPGTPRNEFKEEHYRRIAYVNDRYTDSSGLPGWKTDRGRIYILFGPPDEINSAPSGGDGVYPYEQWRYRYIESIGSNVIIEFVDKAGNGEYHQTMDPKEKRIP